MCGRDCQALPNAPFATIILVILIQFVVIFDFHCRIGTEHTMCRSNGRSTDDSTESYINRQNGSVSTASNYTTRNKQECVRGWKWVEFSAQCFRIRCSRAFAQLLPKIYCFQFVVRCCWCRLLPSLAYSRLNSPCYEFSIWFTTLLGPSFFLLSSILFCFPYEPSVANKFVVTIEISKLSKKKNDEQQQQRKIESFFLYIDSNT